MPAALNPGESDWLEPGERSSRLSADAAGWPRQGGGQQEAGWNDRLKELKDRRWRDFSWLTARALLDSANDQIAKLIHDLVNARRARWMAARRSAGVDPGLLVTGHEGATSCLILGDPGEADGSQYAVIQPMLAVDEERASEFMVVLSDVIYPAGDVNDYVNGFYEAYRDYRKPIFALPGNHDWYDGLNGFMFHFCGAEALPPTTFRRSSYSAPERFAAALWRKADRPNRTLLREHRTRRAEQGGALGQPGPYWAMDIDGVRLIAIDTGIKGTIDREQGEWLLRVSRESEQPNVLLTGKPLWVNGEYKPTQIEWGNGSPAPPLETVDDIVCHEPFGYVAAIGGDVHNYQRQTMRMGQGGTRSVEYVTAGGSGAYMSPTHTIGRVGRTPLSDEHPLPPGVQPPKDEDFRCYPTRGDSLAYYSDWFGQRVLGALRWSLVALVASLAVLVLLAVFGDVPHGWLRVLLIALVGGVGSLAVAGGAGWLAHKLFARFYRTVGVVLTASLVLVGLYALGHAFDAWVPLIMLVGAGTLLAPILLVLLGYYGFSSERQLKRDFAACTAVVATVVLALHRHLDVALDLLTITLAVAAVALLLLAVGRWREFGKRRAERAEAETLKPAERGADAVDRRIQEARTKPKQWITLTLFVYSVIPAALIATYWGVPEVRYVPVAAAGLVLVVSVVLLAVIVVGGGKALGDLRSEGHIDPDEALSYLHQHGIVETVPDQDASKPPARVGAFCPTTERMCELLLPSSGIRKLLTGRITEIGNADEPPMFKSFLHLAVENGTLVITCYGVTGWKDHETNVPVEDRVRIPLR